MVVDGDIVVEEIDMMLNEQMETDCHCGICKWAFCCEYSGVISQIMEEIGEKIL